MGEFEGSRGPVLKMLENQVNGVSTNKMKEIIRLQEQLRDGIMDCIQRRKGEMVELQSETEELGNQMIQEVTMKVLHKIEMIMNTLESILCRCEKVEAKFNSYRRDNSVKSQQVEELEAKFDSVRSELRDYFSLVERVTGIFSKTNRLNNQTIKTINDKFSRLSGNDSHSALQDQIQKFHSNFESNSKLNAFNANNQFSNFVIQEFKSIKNAINSTSKLRQEADDSIANAMKEFTDTLQNGLKIAVSHSKY
ncbi:putative SF-assemblin [Cryptosporidium felis]|nr:putative SF-assemblin [Cryptosporidium felis]